MIYYLADPHLGHRNIITLCRRPFGSVGEMDARIVAAIRTVDSGHNRLVCAGDFTFHWDRFSKEFGELQFPENNTLVMGNHDRMDTAHLRKLAGTWFRRIVGERNTWRSNHLVVQDKLPGKSARVLVSHLPQHDLLGCDYNVYGHFHNNLFTDQDFPFNKEFLWVLKDERYLNAGVEITDYRPMTLADLIETNEEAKTRVW